jgi:Asp-tRNA(Asn)/Glu-tRNA(Gln) amidotransferase C subunit
MDTSPEKYVRKLTEVSQIKYALLSQIFDLTQLQTDALSKEDLDELGQIIEKKQKIIVQIAPYDTDFEVYFKRLKYELQVESLDELKNLKIAGIRELKTVIDSIVKLMGQINEIDSKNQIMAKDQRDKLSLEITKLRQGKTVNSAYNPKPIITNSSMFDTKK